MRRARVVMALALALTSAGCAGHRLRPVDETSNCTPSVPIPPARSLGQDPSPVVVATELHATNGARTVGVQRTIRFELERAPSDVDLGRVLVLAGGRPLAIGANGTILVRSPEEGWKAEASTTTARLEDAALLPPSTVLVVGSGGTALTRSATGAWATEPTGTDADLHGALVVGERAIAGGARGKMLERRRDGGWTAIDTHTTVDLIALGHCAGHVCALAREGVLVDCLAEGAGPFTCVPRTIPPGYESLGADESLIGPGKSLALDTTRRSDVRSPAPRWRPGTPRDPLRRTGGGRGPFDRIDRIDVGLDGSPVLVANPYLYRESATTVSLPYASRIHDATMSGADGWLVGEGGLVVHASVEGAMTMGVCLL